ncbi:MAG TPA: hypothetical protein VGC85_01160 [Chthoniobacterales bacterium]|jgi:hypothetical protein
MSNPTKNTQPPGENNDEIELKDLAPEGEQIGGGQPLPSTIAGGGGQGAAGVNDKSEA